MASCWRHYFLLNFWHCGLFFQRKRATFVFVRRKATHNPAVNTFESVSVWERKRCLCDCSIIFKRTHSPFPCAEILAAKHCFTPSAAFVLIANWEGKRWAHCSDRFLLLHAEFQRQSVLEFRIAEHAREMWKPVGFFFFSHKKEFPRSCNRCSSSAEAGPWFVSSSLLCHQPSAGFQLQLNISATHTSLLCTNRQTTHLLVNIVPSCLAQRQICIALWSMPSLVKVLQLFKNIYMCIFRVTLHWLDSSCSMCLLFCLLFCSKTSCTPCSSQSAV